MIPTERPSLCSVRFAISAGPLTAVLLQQRQAEAARQGMCLPGVLTTTELLHLQLIRKAMPEGSTWEDAVAAIEVPP